MVPLDDSCQRSGVLLHEAAHKGQALVDVGFEHAVPVREDGHPLLSELHVQASVPQVGDRQGIQFGSPCLR